MSFFTSFKVLLKFNLNEGRGEQSEVSPMRVEFQLYLHCMGRKVGRLEGD